MLSHKSIKMPQSHDIQNNTTRMRTCSCRNHGKANNHFKSSEIKALSLSRPFSLRHETIADLLRLIFGNSQRLIVFGTGTIWLFWPMRRGRREGSGEEGKRWKRRGEFDLKGKRAEMKREEERSEERRGSRREEAEVRSPSR